MEERYSWMTEADQGMLQLGLEPVPWDHFAEAVEGENHFQAIEQRASEEQAMQIPEPPTPSSLVGVTMVIRSETMVSAFRQVSMASEAESSTTDLLGLIVKALPEGAMLDLIVETPAMYQALKSCADIVSHGWDVDQYCHHAEWKEVMTV
jgi:hypothetical protein